MAETTAHGWSILDGERGVWTLDYSFGGGRSNCFAVRFGTGQVVVFSPAYKMKGEQFDDLASLGTVSAVVATNGYHHLGLAEWRTRFPAARFFAPTEAMPRIRKKNPQAGALEPLSALRPLLGDEVIVHEATNTKCGELYVIVPRASGAVWFVSDILANIPQLPSSLPIKLLFKLSKSGPGYRIFHLALMALVKDKRALFQRMLEDLETYPPTVVVPAHGVPLKDTNVAEETRILLQASL